MNTTLLNNLVAVGWTRAQVTTLYLFCAPCRPYSYATLNHPDSLARIVHVLRGKEFMPPKDAICVPFTIPSIISGWERGVELLGVRKVLEYPRNSLLGALDDGTDEANAGRPQKRQRSQVTSDSDAASPTLTTTDNSLELRQGEDVHIGLVDSIRGNDTTESSQLDTTAIIAADLIRPTVDDFSEAPPSTGVSLRIQNRQIAQDGTNSLAQHTNARTSSLEVDSTHVSENFDPYTQFEWLPPGLSFASQQLFTRMPFVLPYESQIFSVVQRGDIHATRELLTARKALIDVVDPYGLGLFYYASYYCWKGHGHAVAFGMCKALLEMGVNDSLPDDIGNTPEMTILDNILCGTAMGDPSLNRDSTITDIAVLFGLGSRDLWTEYMASRGFTEVHRILLRSHDNDFSLRDSLRSLEDHGMLSAIIDCADSQGRSPLAWAVEYGWANATDTLVSFGANPNQVRRSVGGHESPLLHLAIAGPSSTRSSEVVEILLNAGVDVNARDEEQ
ncbi:hypothetical protein K458DRAFT_72 [Lentithecium fluviatile CBS 122367]|uniref:Uncharacterized protein n=1 Tax=Lentithecium fluviatile CBS 122367 TaxID=1168545 RepID=A0A6G1JMC2_9PLEO|nr:hypothetical protein K458DRAFT_72 [Lentithecium fluviatile CBS 122367]